MAKLSRAAKLRLVEDNLRLVVQLAKKQARPKGMVFSDLTAAGEAGLRRAVETYDPNGPAPANVTKRTYLNMMTDPPTEVTADDRLEAHATPFVLEEMRRAIAMFEADDEPPTSAPMD